MICVPEPPTDAIPVNEPVSTDIGPSERATVTFTADSRENHGFYLPVLAASKYDRSSYEVSLDGRNVYGPAEIPPTDVDDLGICFLPAFEFSQEIEVQIVNLGDSTREYHIQPIGFKQSAGGSDGT